MKIYNYPVINTSVQKTGLRTPSFKSSFRSVYNDKMGLKYNTNTCFFRKDLDWNKFADYLNQTYKNADKVNIISYGCSTGEEPVSLFIILDKKLGKDAEKFLPISAYDIDTYNIKRASNKVFEITKDELQLIRQNTDNDLNKYFISHIDKNEMLGTLRLKDDYKNKFVFKESDILKDVKKIPPKNTVLLCRNFFPYMTLGEERNIVKQIGKKLDSSSIVVLGKFDIDYGVEKSFEKEGFVHTEQYNVMKKLPLYKALFKKLVYKIKSI